MGKKYTYQEVYDYFESKDCHLLETEYIKNDILMKYICECGNESYISFSSFKNADSRCKECGEKKSADSRRLTYQYVFDYFKSKDCELLEDHYINNSTDMKYKCKCGNITYIDFNHFRNAKGCMECEGNKKFTYEFVKQSFETIGYKLLETEYINDATKMKYECDKGHIRYTTFNNFRQGYRCRRCEEERRIGEGNARWNPNLTDEQRKENESRQKDPKVREWRKKVFQRDNFCCQICGSNKSGTLNVHHLNSWDWCIEERFNVENGITLCKYCHDNFHIQYKYGNNTKEQFEEFKLQLNDNKDMD